MSGRRGGPAAPAHGQRSAGQSGPAPGWRSTRRGSGADDRHARWPPDRRSVWALGWPAHRFPHRSLYHDAGRTPLPSGSIRVSRSQSRSVGACPALPAAALTTLALASRRIPCGEGDESRSTDTRASPGAGAPRSGDVQPRVDAACNRGAGHLARQRVGRLLRPMQWPGTTTRWRDGGQLREHAQDQGLHRSGTSPILTPSTRRSLPGSRGAAAPSRSHLLRYVVPRSPGGPRRHGPRQTEGSGSARHLGGRGALRSAADCGLGGTRHTAHFPGRRPLATALGGIPTRDHPHRLTLGAAMGSPERCPGRGTAAGLEFIPRSSAQGSRTPPGTGRGSGGARDRCQSRRAKSDARGRWCPASPTPAHLRTTPTRS